MKRIAIIQITYDDSKEQQVLAAIQQLPGHMVPLLSGPYDPAQVYYASHMTPVSYGSTEWKPNTFPIPYHRHQHELARARASNL